MDVLCYGFLPNVVPRFIMKSQYSSYARIKKKKKKHKSTIQKSTVIESRERQCMYGKSISNKLVLQACKERWII